MSRRGAIGLFIATLACTAPPPFVPRPDAVFVGPADLETGVAARGNPDVVVATGLVSSVFETTDAPIFMRAIEVVTWPEDVRVAGTLRMTRPPANGDYRYHFEFLPTVPLTDRWYAIRLSLAELGQRYSTVAPVPEPGLASGEVVHRFFQGSLPLFSTTIGSDGVVTYLTIGASEPVIGAGAASLVSLTGDGTPVTCMAEPGTDVGQELINRGMFHLHCDPIDLTRPVTVHLAPGIRSATGVPLRDVHGATDIVVTWTPSIDGATAPREPAMDFFSSAP